jgi:hypothetical protein
MPKALQSPDVVRDTVVLIMPCKDAGEPSSLARHRFVPAPPEIGFDLSQFGAKPLGLGVPFYPKESLP